MKQSHIGDEDRAFGESVKYDTAVQIINPAPVYTADSTQPGSNGDAGASAVQRYRTDKVKPVEQLQTTERMVSGAGAGSTSGPQ